MVNKNNKSGVIFTIIKDIKKHLSNYKLCDFSIAFYREQIAKREKRFGLKNIEAARKHYKCEIAYLQERIRRTEEYKAKILSLFDYCENDFDRELLQRRFIKQQSYYKISCDICYAERTTFKLYENVFQKLAEKTKDLPDFKF